MTSCAVLKGGNIVGGFEEEEEEPKERLGSVRENPKGRRVLGAVDVDDAVIGPLETAAE